MKHDVKLEVLQKDFNRFSRGESFACEKNRLLINGAPKSGSTYLHRIFTYLPNYNNCMLIPDKLGGRENELCVRKLIMSHHGFDHYASHLHFRYSNTTRDLIHQFGLKPIILTRNIFDTIVSERDFYYAMESEARKRNFSIDVASPSAFIPKCVLEWDELKQFCFIADMVIPWFFNFLITWQFCDEALWATYEDLVANPFEIMSGANQFFNLQLSDSDMNDAINQAKSNPKQTNMNKGVVGRGADLPKEVKDKVYRMADYYSKYDLSAFGL